MANHLMPCDPLIEPLVTDLHSNTKLRVWSLVITIFGDAVLPRGGRVSMQDLLSITRCAGIEPGGLRTAISRLSKDGWIQVKKEGRNSFYTLSEQGISEFIPATQVIYRRPGQIKSKSWIVAIAPPSTTGLRRAAMKKLQELNPSFIHSGLAIWPENRAPAETVFGQNHCLSAVVNQGSPPRWLRELVAGQEMRASYLSLIRLLEPLEQNIVELQQLNPINALTARILMIHRWRRLALRGAHMPEFLLPDDWPATKCSAIVSAIYQALLTKSEEFWLEPTQPKARHELKSRFVIE